MSSKISDKDKKDWQEFLSNKDKIENKDFTDSNNLSKSYQFRKIDLHGFTLEKANNEITKFKKKSFNEKINRIIVITGKGLRSKSFSDPYVSRDLSILKHSVPNYIYSNNDLMKIIKKISNARTEDGGSGAFYIDLKNKL